MKRFLSAVAAVLITIVPILNANHSDCCCDPHEIDAINQETGGHCPAGEPKNKSCETSEGGCGCFLVNSPAACLFENIQLLPVKTEKIITSILDYNFIIPEDIMRPPAG